MGGAPIPDPTRGTGTCTVDVVARWLADGYIRLRRIWAESASVIGATFSVVPVADTSVTR